MKIVVLDGHTLNPGDLNWDPLHALGDCEIYERSTPEEARKRLEKADIVLTNKFPIDRGTIDQAPQLKFIAVTATGYNIVDVKAARDRGIPVANIPAYGTASVAQMTFALLLELAHHTGHHARTVKEGRWAANPDFCYADFPLVELREKTLGIIGFGRIGREVAKIARAFGMKVLVLQRKSVVQDTEVKAVSLDELLRESDVVSLHCPLTPETKGLINGERLALMKPTAFLLNTSRGPLILEEELAAALHEKKIAGAGLDVLSVEPPPKEHPLYKAPNCYITPHLAWATREARQRLMSILISNIRSWQQGQPVNVVN